MTPAFSVGTLPLWRHPIRERTAFRGVDTLDGAYKTDRNTTLAVGDVVPGYPGMIIIALDKIDSGISREWQISAEGSLDQSYPTKTLSRGKRRTIEAGWDERTVRYLSWHAAWKSCTGDAGSNVITCTAHGFPNGKRVYFARLTGGAGLTAQSASSLGVGYYVINRTSNTFQVSTTVGGSAVDFTTTMTAGEVIAGEFALGSPHPSYPYMHLCELTVQDENNDWAVADCVYRGFEEAKPYHRMITVNGQQFSSSEPITISMVGGWNDPRNTNFHLPEVVVTDTYLVGTGTLPTGSVPSFGAPANAPFIPNYVITDSEIDNLTYNYPYGWTIVSTPHQATLNSQISAMVYQVVYRWIWPVLFR
jgi:hypothetical protein